MPIKSVIFRIHADRAYPWRHAVFPGRLRISRLSEPVPVDISKSPCLTWNIRSNIMLVVSLFSRLMQYLFGKEAGVDESRVFLQDQELIAVIKEVARQQRRGEEDIVADFTRVGLNQFLSQNEMENRWASLSHREQQVAALICLGYRNHEIARILTIAPETVKTHLQRIFDKFNLHSSKELRLVLKDWDFRNWWEHNQHE